jgi:signal transduction histidine kinase
LAICYSIVRRHRATIAVDTGAKGTTFYVKFKLPRSPAGAAEVR